jgi:hypothetical protein
MCFVFSHHAVRPLEYALFVIPTKVGIKKDLGNTVIPASAGMTVGGLFTSSSNLE